MDFLFSSFGQVLALILALDPEVLITAWTSIWTSLTAITLAAIIAGPIGLAVGAGRFPGRRAVVILLNTLMALPTVMVSLILYGFLSRQGPLGPLGFCLRVDHLCIEAGRIYVLTGPNGAGKSTLLQALALLVRPQRGEIQIGGKPVPRTNAGVQRLRHRITLVQQRPYLLDATVYQNLGACRAIRAAAKIRRFEARF